MVIKVKLDRKISKLNSQPSTLMDLKLAIKQQTFPDQNVDFNIYYFDQQKDQITLDVEYDFMAFRKFQLEKNKLVKVFIKDIKLLNNDEKNQSEKDVSFIYIDENQNQQLNLSKQEIPAQMQQNQSQKYKMKEEDDIQFIISKTLQNDVQTQINQHDEYYENPLHFSIIDLDKNNNLQQKDVYIDMEKLSNSQNNSDFKENFQLNNEQKEDQKKDEINVDQQGDQLISEKQAQDSILNEIKQQEQKENQLGENLECSVLVAFKEQLKLLHPQLSVILENYKGVHIKGCVGQCGGSRLKPIHLNSCCSLCKQSPIVGGLFKCSVLKDYQLCEECEQKTEHPYDLIKVKKQTLLVDNQQPTQQKFQTEYTRRFLVSELLGSNPIQEFHNQQLKSDTDQSFSQKQPSKRYETSNDIEIKIQEQFKKSIKIFYKEAEMKVKKAILKQKIDDIFRVKVNNSKKLKELNQDLDCQIIINMIINDSSILEQLK